MSVPFSRIYDKFFYSINDYELLSLAEDETEDILFNYLENSIVEFKKCKKLNNHIDKEMQQFTVDLTLEEIYILSLGMVLSWLSPQINRLNLLRQSLGDRDFKLSSNWHTLNSLRELEYKTRNDLERKITSYTYNNLERDYQVK